MLIDTKEIIVECVIGSKLYGTNFSKSDDDFLGVFLPDKHDLLGIKSPPAEISADVKASGGEKNQAGDIDRKFYSLKRYFDLILTGQQSTAIEMLFAPEAYLVKSSPVWDEITNHRDRFLSKKSCVGTIGFARAQAYRAYVKGGNLKRIHGILDGLAGDTSVCSKTIGQLCGVDASTPRPSKIWLYGHEIDLVSTDAGFPVIEIAGRKYDINGRAKFLADSLKELMGRYGSRVQAASDAGYDFKSLYHCFRLLGEAKELLETGFITLPRPKEEIEFLMKIRSNEPGRGSGCDLGVNFFEEINRRMDEVCAINSTLPESPDYKFADDLCYDILLRQFYRK